MWNAGPGVRCQLRADSIGNETEVLLEDLIEIGVIAPGVATDHGVELAAACGGVD